MNLLNTVTAIIKFVLLPLKNVLTIPNERFLIKWPNSMLKFSSIILQSD